MHDIGGGGGGRLLWEGEGNASFGVGGEGVPNVGYILLLLHTLYTPQKVGF